MSSATLVNHSVKTISWTGRTLSALVVVFMIFDAAVHILEPAPVAEAFARLDLSLRLSVGLGVVELVCTALYAIPRTAFFGAVLLTGYLGGAVAIQLRAGSSWFETVFPTIVAVLLWSGLTLRDSRVRALASL